MMPMVDALRKVLRRVHFPLETMLVRVRWHAAYPLRIHPQIWLTVSLISRNAMIPAAMWLSTTKLRRQKYSVTTHEYTRLPVAMRSSEHCVRCGSEQQRSISG